ncbi:MAG: GumC family protein [Roseovarius sp.]
MNAPSRGASGSRDPDVVDMRALFRRFLRRWKLLLGISVLAAYTAYFLVSLIPSSYTATAKILLDPSRAQFLTGIEVLESRQPSQQVINGEIAILTSNLLLEDVIETVGQDRILAIVPELKDLPEASRVDGLVWAVRERLTVWAENQSYVISMSFGTRDPQLTMDLPNVLAERYLAHQIDNRKETIRQAGSWLEERLAVLADQVAQTEEDVAKMRTESLIENGGTLENASEQISRLNNQLVEARAAHTRAEAQLLQLRQVMEKDGPLAAAALVPSTAMDELQARAVDLRQLDAGWAETVDPDHPRRARILRDLKQLEGEIAAEVRLELENLQGSYEVARLSEEAIRETISQMERRVVEISRGEIAQRKTEREAQAARQTYEALLSRLTDARTQERLQNAEAKLIERATLPLSPSAPRPKLMAALAGSTVLALVSVWAFLAELTATTFRTPREVSDEVDLPVVAALPYERWFSNRGFLKQIRKKPFSPFAENIRKLMTMLLMRDEYAISTSLTVLSTMPGEGSTTTALALAEMSARTGRAAIFVDCDLRQASVARQFGWNARHDLADVIAGDCDLQEAIITPDGMPFDALICARPSPEMAEQLSSLDLESIVEELKQFYDLVILQGPALLSSASSVIVAKASDNRVLVVESEKTKRSEVKEGLAMLDKLHLPVDGIVFNKMRKA